MEIIWVHPALTLILGYLLGSIPFGLLLTRITGAGDLRTIGSGNIGATNVLRTGRKGLAAATMLLDMAKGAAAVLVGRWLAVDGVDYAITGGCAAFIGHCYPIWLRFNGGKGVATLLGIGFALDWRIGLISALVWLGGLAISRISSVGGLASALAAPIVAFLIGEVQWGVALTGLALMVLWKHRANIARLRAGTEPRIGQKT
ncbi:MAG: glycerol-3-phosphate 1-O-acyltransferase PlsY [Alphaproteobacteria bacterium]|nr:glycerol-3-phosphate 1-O-acyltransferase PlsY [Alphaproteobacteria bacterium]MDE2041827.1 glycerol-3-phosphate 1-O-acyltransferase PlsY [Alphaproteobacteria bacterium]MDE2339689.1 glycerol-3-phosphate 1-O-acyltransferase PlsY [Alphaproteobacteria bacterium]